MSFQKSLSETYFERIYPSKAIAIAPRLTPSFSANSTRTK